MIAGFAAMSKLVPQSARGGAEVRHWTPDSLSLLRSSIRGGRPLAKGHTYAQLFIRGSLWMSDTPDEMVAHLPVTRAKGRVLIVGLGLGMSLHRALLNQETTHVDVIEKDRDVARLVWPHVGKSDARATLHLADAFKWQPQDATKYDFIWLDIWLTAPDTHELKPLRDRYRKWLKRGGYIGAWEGNK